MASQEQSDEMLLGLASRHGGIEPLLRAFFSFLHRKTDFYVTFPPGMPNARMGFTEGDAEKMLLKHFRSFPYKPLPGAGSSSSSSSAPPPPSTPAPVAAAAARPSPPTSSTSSKVGSGDAKPAVQYTAEGKQVPIGNGGATDRYYWTQTLEETSVYVDVPPGTRARDVKCDWGRDRITLSVQGSTLLDGPLGGAIRPGECLWTLEGGSTLVLSLEKAGPSWWRSVLQGDPEIDTSKVDSTAKVADYDGETQGALRKIMFDQQQKARGLPTSDELQMQSLLEKSSLLPGSPLAPPPPPPKEGEGES